MTLARQAATGSGGLKAVLSSFQSVTGFPIEAQVQYCKQAGAVWQARHRHSPSACLVCVASSLTNW